MHRLRSNILIKSARPRLIVEAGTAYGYSTLWLAEAAEAIGSRVMGFEMNEQKIRFARKKLERAELNGMA